MPSLRSKKVGRLLEPVPGIVSKKCPARKRRFNPGGRQGAPAPQCYDQSHADIQPKYNETESLVATLPSRQSPLREMVVLYVDDNPDDQLLLQAAGREAGVPFQWQIAPSAQQAMSYLESLVNPDSTREACWPELILLDIWMPDPSGLRVLAHIRATSELRRLPVVVFTGVPTDDVMEAAYRLGANSCLEKPHKFEDLVTLASSMYRKWGAGKRLESK